MRRPFQLIAASLIAGMVAIGAAGCASVAPGSLKPWTSTAGEQCAVDNNKTGQFVLVESFVNAGSSPVTMTDATVSAPSNISIMGKPYSYPGRNAGLRISPYPFPTEALFRNVRSAWAKRVDLDGVTVDPNQVVFVALQVQLKNRDRKGASKPVNVRYTEGGQQKQSDGAFTFDFEPSKCS